MAGNGLGLYRPFFFIRPAIRALPAGPNRYGLPFCLLQLFHLGQLPDHEQRGKGSCHQIGHRRRVHDTFNAENQGQDYDQGQEEDDLPGKGDEDALGRLTDGGKEIGRNGLKPVQKSEEQENPEVLLCKVEIFLASRTENTDDLARHQLEA